MSRCVEEWMDGGVGVVDGWRSGSGGWVEEWEELEEWMDGRYGGWVEEW